MNFIHINDILFSLLGSYIFSMPFVFFHFIWTATKYKIFFPKIKDISKTKRLFIFMGAILIWPIIYIWFAISGIYSVIRDFLES